MPGISHISTSTLLVNPMSLITKHMADGQCSSVVSVEVLNASQYEKVTIHVLQDPKQVFDMAIASSGAHAKVSGQETIDWFCPNSHPQF